jgi:hypothetical protein
MENTGLVATHSNHYDMVKINNAKHENDIKPRFSQTSAARSIIHKILDVRSGNMANAQQINNFKEALKVLDGLKFAMHDTVSKCEAQEAIQKFLHEHGDSYMPNYIRKKTFERVWKQIAQNQILLSDDLVRWHAMAKQGMSTNTLNRELHTNIQTAFDYGGPLSNLKVAVSETLQYDSNKYALMQAALKEYWLIYARMRMMLHKVEAFGHPADDSAEQVLSQHQMDEHRGGMVFNHATSTNQLTSA